MKRTILTLNFLLVATVSLAPLGAQSGDPAAWHNERPEQPDVLLIQNATIWTSGPEGTLEEVDMLVRAGKVVRLGQDLRQPQNAVVVDASGRHVTAGLIDAHSHTALTGGVNEGTDNITAEVRTEDIINPQSINIYRQLAGGLTAANLLHGSANSIGGQNAIIKMRWGAPADGLLLEGARPGIKFALGENPKQSNWGVEQRRYPQTRAGVEQSIREGFQAALDYRRTSAEYEADAERATRVPPRRDLQLEALAEILDGRRDVHSHSYRADEILMLMRVAEEFGFRVKCFQHVLEGYKVADEMAEHGATASTFSDWWAYKYEVIDAIPYNGAIMWDRGVVVSFNSDSSELARRMNLEAAKAVRYGGVPEAEALKFVTLNAAIQLGVDDRIGSLEPGKDADFVVWSGHPLSTYSVAEETWIDGRKYFDRAADLAYRDTLAAERAELLTKARTDEDEGDEPATEAETDADEPAVDPEGASR